jgi:asparagine synthase (glutamine-hydrolysing)
MSGAAGVILGTLFAKPDVITDTANPQPIRTFDAQQTERVIQSRGRDLATHYWGSYVALFRGSGDETVVVRAPQGRLPCLHASFHGVRVLFSHPKYFLRLNISTPTINWDYLLNAVSGVGPVDQTGLQEVQQLAPGQRAEFHPQDVQLSWIWRPEPFAADVLSDPITAASTLRTIVRYTTHAWASCFERIVLTLSGGFDSSTVLSCLHDAPTRPQVTCLTRFDSSAVGDERNYARTAAQHYSVELIEHPRVPYRLADALEATDLSEQPASSIGKFDMVQREQTLCRSIGARTIFDGAGGDIVFYNNVPTLACVDRVSQTGFQAGLFDFALNCARSEGLSVWRVLMAAVQQGRRRSWRPNEQLLELHRLLAPQSVEAIKGTAFEESFREQSGRALPPGKAWQAYALLLPQPYNPPFLDATQAEYISPLLSQPVVELALRIPTYVLFLNGISRGLARVAFAADLPAAITRRSTKGGAEDYASRLVRNDLGFARELLLEGALVRRGILSKARVEEALSDMPSSFSEGIGEMLLYLNIESWLRTWDSARARLST